MIGLIVAYTKNRVIGSEGRIPWRIKGEQRRFKELTTGNVVIMGRKSYEEIGHPLPNRYTVVVSSTADYEAENCITVNSLPELFHKTIMEAAHGAHKRLRQVEFRTQAPDHPILWAADSSYYLKFYIFQVVDER